MHKNKAKPKEAKHNLTRVDGWANLITGLGTSSDKRMRAQVMWEPRAQEEYEYLYTGDELASRIVNVVPEEALRKGWEWVGVEKDVQEAVKHRCADLDLRGALERTWKWARVYGGACLHIVTDTNDPGSPLKEGEQVIGLRDLSRYDLRILTTDIEVDFASPNWGHPKIYYLQVQMGSDYKNYPIHWTRMIRFDGFLLPRRTFIENNYWHDSILNKLVNAIRNYQTSNDAVANMLQDFNVDVYKMKNLANLVAAGKESLIKSRIEMMSYSKSSIRALIMDADEEEYVNIQRSVTGIDTLLEKQANRLVAATDIPHTKLLGESPDGSNATGNSTSALWYDHIQSEQENYLRPKLQRVLDAVFYDMPQLAFKFKPLYQLTELEQADLRGRTAQTDQIYLTTGVLDPSEVTQSRFGGEEYSIETELDIQARSLGLISPGSANPNLFTDPTEEDPDTKEEEKPETTTPKDNLKSDQEHDNTNMPASLTNTLAKSPSPQSSGATFEFKNEIIPDIPQKIKGFISPSMSLPFRDPKTEPKLPQAGVNSSSRTILPTIGNGITAPSGNQGGKDRTDTWESQFEKPDATET